MLRSVRRGPRRYCHISQHSAGESRASLPPVSHLPEEYTAPAAPSSLSAVLEDGNLITQCRCVSGMHASMQEGPEALGQVVTDEMHVGCFRLRCLRRVARRYVRS